MTEARRLLGCFELLIDDRTVPMRALGSRKQRQLLKMLLLERDRLVPTDRIVEASWEAPRPTVPRQGRR